jgi:drug/metabolite transporter (DMT)-like permease
MKPRDSADYAFLALAWGLSFLSVRVVSQAFGWVGAVSLRALVAAAAVWLMAKATRRTLVFAAGWWPFAVVGATGVAGQLLAISYAIPRIGTAMSAIIVATIPLFAMVISRLFGLEKITLRTLSGLVMGFGGIVLLVGFPVVTIDEDFLFGSAICLSGCILAAFGSNYASLRLKGTDSWEVTIGSFVFGGFLTLPGLALVPFPVEPQPFDYAMLVFLGCVMSGMTYVRFYRLMASIGPTRAISVEFVVTVVATSVGVVFLGEQLSPVQYAGAAIILLGCALVLGILPVGRDRDPAIKP